jgi:AcrR family transcriptional regulator
MARKTLERQARKQLVVESARRVFAERGVENTKMEDIAAAADYTRRTLYAYFSDRDEICLMVFLEDLERRWRFQQAALEAGQTGLDKIRIWAETFYVFARENPDSMRLQMYWDFRGIDKDRIGSGIFGQLERLNDELANHLRQTFRQGISDGSLRTGLHIDMCISQFLYSLRSIVYRALSPAYSFAAFDPDRYVHHYLDLFLNAIARSKDTRP